jgi:hypothetical protein
MGIYQTINNSETKKKIVKPVSRLWRDAGNTKKEKNVIHKF